MLDNRQVIGTIGIMSGIPTLPTPFVKSLIGIINYNNEYVCSQNELIAIKYAETSLHSYARNDLALNMQGGWLLMLDTDHIFPCDTLGRLLWISRKYDIDVVTGIYQQKKLPYQPVIYNWDGEGIKRILSWDNEIIPIDASGAGCLFVKGRVFKRITEELGEMPFSELKNNSEDISFFRRLAKLGIKSFCVPDIQANHLAYQEVTLDMMEA